LKIHTVNADYSKKMDYIWNIKPQGTNEQVDHLSEILNIDKSLCNLLVQRGVTTFDEARTFFRPKMEELHDPFLMKDMDKAVTRLENAIKNKEKVMVYGDYDVDGTTSVALMYSFLRKVYDEQKLTYYIPDRYNEGYGISFKGIDYAADNKFTLIVALDCGIKAVEKIEYARKKGIDFIICDHHTAGEHIPRAIAVLDPKQSDCKYPFKELSGCGVGFKLIQAFCQNNGIPLSELDYYLDIVTVSIASDIVPITGENRILAYFGLKRLSTKPCIGLKAIMNIAGIGEKPLTITDLVFKVGPRINAAGRIESGNEAVELLITDNEESAHAISHNINTYNSTRKDLDHNITQEALRMIEMNEELTDRKTTVLYNPYWHKGVIGIVASRLIDTYYRPTVILTESHGLASGSARSVPGFNLYDAIDACSDLLETFGGHKYAAGLTMKLENVRAFQEKFERIVSERILSEQMKPIIEIDAKLKFKEITPKFYRILKQFAPFGPENMSPVFVSESVSDLGTSRVVGATREHLKLDLVQEKVSMSGIAFGMAYKWEQIPKDQPFDISYAIDENEFKGNTSLQLMVKDVKVNRSQS